MGKIIYKGNEYATTSISAKHITVVAINVFQIDKTPHDYYDNHRSKWKNVCEYGMVVSNVSDGSYTKNVPDFLTDGDIFKIYYDASGSSPHYRYKKLNREDYIIDNILFLYNQDTESLQGNGNDQSLYTWYTSKSYYDKNIPCTVINIRYNNNSSQPDIAQPGIYLNNKIITDQIDMGNFGFNKRTKVVFTDPLDGDCNFYQYNGLVFEKIFRRSNYNDSFERFDSKFRNNAPPPISDNLNVGEILFIKDDSYSDNDTDISLDLSFKPNDVYSVINEYHQLSTEEERRNSYENVIESIENTILKIDGKKIFKLASYYYSPSAYSTAYNFTFILKDGLSNNTLNAISDSGYRSYNTNIEKIAFFKLNIEHHSLKSDSVKINIFRKVPITNDTKLVPHKKSKYDIGSIYQTVSSETQINIFADYDTPAVDITDSSNPVIADLHFTINNTKLKPYKIRSEFVNFDFNIDPPVDVAQEDNMSPITSNAVYEALQTGSADTFIGTHDEWNQKTTEEKKAYTIVNFTDDYYSVDSQIEVKIIYSSSTDLISHDAATSITASANNSHVRLAKINNYHYKLIFEAFNFIGRGDGGYVILFTMSKSLISNKKIAFTCESVMSDTGSDKFFSIYATTNNDNNVTIELRSPSIENNTTYNLCGNLDLYLKD